MQLTRSLQLHQCIGIMLQHSDPNSSSCCAVCQAMIHAECVISAKMHLCETTAFCPGMQVFRSCSQDIAEYQHEKGVLEQVAAAQQRRIKGSLGLPRLVAASQATNAASPALATQPIARRIQRGAPYVLLLKACTCWLPGGCLAGL